MINKIQGADWIALKFPAGEIQVKVSNVDPLVTIYADLDTSDDIMTVILLENALKNAGAKQISLNVKYLPYARQDRICASGEAYSLYVLLEMLYKFYEIQVCDIHSNAHYLIARGKIVNKPQWKCLEETVPNDILSKVVPIAPDKGSTPKMNEICKNTTPGFLSFVQCTKVRDPNTGKLSGFDCEIRDFNGKDLLIIDDICDGGGTFIGLAEMLKTRNVGDLYLYVTHGIFSKGMDELNKYFKKIYCYNNIYERKLEDE